MSASDGVVLVGGAGFIGRHLATRLAADGIPAVILDRRPSEEVPGARVEVGDVADPAALDRVLRPGLPVVHLAWSSVPASSNADPGGDARENLLGSLALLEACRARGAGRVIFLSSGGTVYGSARRLPIRETDPTEPICAYGVSKLAAEKYFGLFRHLYGLDAVILRPSTAYGPGQDLARGQGAATVFTHLAARGEPITIWGDGSVVRDFLHVEDLVEAIVRVLKCDPGPDGPRLFNVGTGEGTSLSALVQAIGRVLGRRPEVRYAPGRALDVPANVLDVGRLCEATGWRPRIPLDEGIWRTLRAWEAKGGVPAVGRRPA